MAGGLVLVTGGAGFIGSHLVAALLERGRGVRVLDDFLSGRREHLPVRPDLEVIEGDLRDPGVFRCAVAGVEVILIGYVPGIDFREGLRRTLEATLG